MNRRWKVAKNPISVLSSTLDLRSSTVDPQFTMTPLTLFILLFIAGIVLMLAELGLPTHGVLGVLGGGLILVGIGVAFSINQWLGVGVLVGTVALAPLVAVAFANLWPRTFMGRRILLPPIESAVHPPRVGLGQIGLAVSELRPMGWCEFNDQRHEVRAEMGMIAPGARVKVVSVDDGRLIVRGIENSTSDRI